MYKGISKKLQRWLLLGLAALLLLPAWPPVRANAETSGWTEATSYDNTSIGKAAMVNGVWYTLSYSYLNKDVNNGIGANGYAYYLNAYDGTQWKRVFVLAYGQANPPSSNVKYSLEAKNGVLYIVGQLLDSATSNISVWKCEPEKADEVACTFYNGPNNSAAHDFNTAIGDDGTLYVAWLSMNTLVPVVRSFDGAQWTNPNLVFPAADVSGSYVHPAAGGGQVYLAATDDSNPFKKDMMGKGLYVARKGSSMANSTKLAGQNADKTSIVPTTFNIAVYDGIPYLAYYNAGVNTIYLKRYDAAASQWVSMGEYTPGAIYTDWWNSHAFDVYADESGVYVAYSVVQGANVLKSDGTSLALFGGGYTKPCSCGNHPNQVYLSRDAERGTLYVSMSGQSGTGSGGVSVIKYGVSRTGPKLTAVTPANGSRNVPIDASLSLDFDEVIVAGSGKIELRRAGDDKVMASISASDASQVTISFKRATIKPAVKLKYGTDYYVSVEPGAFKDLDGNPYAGTTDTTEAKEWSFETEKDVVPPSLTALTPADDATNVAIDAPISLSFNENVVPTAKEIGIYTAAGVKVESFMANDADHVTVTDNQAALKLTSALAYNTGYYILVPAGAFKDESGNDYEGLTSPTSWNFHTVPDTVPPKLISLSPTTGQQGVPIASKLTMRFSEPVKAAAGKKLTLYSNYQMRETYDLTNSSQVSVSGDTVTITPSKKLPYNVYNYVVADAGAFTDLAGNPWTETQNWSFTTEADTIPPEVVKYTPANGTQDAAIRTDLVFEFGEDQVYRNLQNPLLTIYRASDERLQDTVDLSQATYGETVDPHTYYTVKLSKPLDYDTEYYVQITPKAYRDVNGVPYPGITDKTTWRFKTSKDTYPPAAAAYSPTPGATSVPVDAKLAVTFDEPVKAGSGSFDVYKTATDEKVASVPANATSDRLSIDGSTVTVALSEPLESNTGYYVKIDAGFVKDLPGNSYPGIADSATWSFTTAKDTTPPVLTSLSPADDAKDVAVDLQQLKLTFNEKVKAGAGKSIKLYRASDNGLLAAMPSGDAVIAGKTATFELSGKMPAGLEYGTDYYVLVEVGAFADMDDNPFAGISTKTGWNFTTTYKISADDSTIVASPAQVVSDGQATSTVTVTLKDDKQRVIAGRAVKLTAGGGSSVVLPAEAVTDANGQAVFKVKDTVVEKTTYRASAGSTTITPTASVSFVAGPFSAASSTIAATPATVPADGKSASAIVVRVTDAYGHGLAGQAVTLTAGGGSSRIAPEQTISDASGKAVFAVTDAKAEQVTYAAKVGAAALPKTVKVTFETPYPGDGGPKASVLRSTVTALPSVVAADGLATATVAVTLKDGAGAPVSGKAVTLTPDGGSSVVTALQSVSDDEGRAVFAVKDAVAEQVTYKAADTTDSVTLAERARVVFETPESAGDPGPGTGPDAKPSVLLSTVTADPSVVKADGVSASTVTVTLKDLFGWPLAGKTVSLKPSGGSSTVAALSDGVTDADGVARFTVMDATPEQVTYTASVAADKASIVQTAAVAFEKAITEPGGDPGQPGGDTTSVLLSTVNASPAVVLADGTSAAIVTVRLKNAAGEPIAGKKVTLTPDGGSSVIAALADDVTDADGAAAFQVTNVCAEPVVYAAKVAQDEATVAQTAKVVFESAPYVPGKGKTSVLDSTVSAAPATVAADGEATSTITVTLRDSAGQPVSGKTVKLYVDGGDSVISPATAVSDADGKAVFTVADDTAEQATYTARDESDGVTIAQRATVTFEAVQGEPGTEKPSVLLSTVTASPTTAAANGSDASTVTVTLKDVLGRALEGRAVTLTAVGGDAVVTAASAVSDASGQAVFAVTDGTAERVAFVAKADGVTLAQRAVVTFEEPEANAGQAVVSLTRSTVAVSPDTVAADGAEASVVTVTLLDADGAPIAGKRAALRALGGSSSIEAIADTTGANGEASFLVKDATAEQVIYSASVPADGVTLAQRAAVTFESPASGGGSGEAKASVTRSTVVAAPAIVQANGADASTIAVTVKDAEGTPLAGKTVSLTPTGGQSVVTAANAVTDANGRATFGVTDAKAEQVTYVAKVETDGVIVAQRATVTFDTALADPAATVADVLRSTVKAAPASVAADGASASTITVTLLDTDGEPVAGKTVSLNAVSGSSSVVVLNAITDADGKARFQATNTAAEQVAYAAYDETDEVAVAEQAKIYFESPSANADDPEDAAPSLANSTIQASPSMVLADGTASSTITVTLKDGRNRPVGGKTVSLTALNGGSAITPLIAVSDENGQAKFEVTNTMAELVRYAASDETDDIALAGTAAVVFESPAANEGDPGDATPSLANSTIQVSPSTVPADGTSSSTITVTLLDGRNRPVNGKAVSLTALNGNSVIAALNGTSDANGQASFTVTNAKAEQVTYAAKDETDGVALAATATVAFRKPATEIDPAEALPSVLKSTVEASPSEVAANGQDASTITVALKDVYGRPVAGKTVKLAADGGSAAIAAIRAVTDANGQALFQATDIAAEPVVFSATDATDGIAFAKTATVLFKATASSGSQTVSITRSTVKASPSEVAADGTEAATVTVTLMNANGQAIGGKTVKLTASGGHSVIETASAVTNSAGQALFKVRSAYAEQVVYSAKETASGATLTATATVTFRATAGTGSQATSVARSTVIASPTTVPANGIAASTITVTLLNVNGQPVVGKTVSLSSTGVAVDIAAVNAVSDAAGQAVFKATGEEIGQAVFSATDATGGAKLAQEAIVAFREKDPSLPLDPKKIDAVEGPGTVTTQDVLPGATVKVYDKDDTVIGTGTNPGPGVGPVVIAIPAPGVKEGDTLTLTQTELGKKESVPVETLVRKDVGTTPPIRPERIVTDPERDEVTVTDVQPGTTITIYDKDGKPLGTGTNPGPGAGPVVIAIDAPGIEEGDVIYATATDPELKESGKTPKTVPIFDKKSKPVPESNIVTDPGTGEVTVKDVPPGATITIYDEDGEPIGTGTNPGPGSGPVVIRVPGLKEGDVLKVTAKEPGKTESDPTKKTATVYDKKSKPIPEPNIVTDPERGEVTVKDVLPGVTVTIYDKDGKPIGTGTNPGPGTGPVVIRTPGLKPGDVIGVTATEPGKKESVKTTVTARPKKLYDVTIRTDVPTVTVTVTVKPGANPAEGHAYLVIQGLRAGVPVLVKGSAFDAKHPQSVVLTIPAEARVGDTLHAVVVSKPESARSDIGYSLSDEATTTVGGEV